MHKLFKIFQFWRFVIKPSVIIYSDDLIPVMTDYVTDGITVSANSESNSSSVAWYAFDKNNNTWWGDVFTLPTWIKVDFGTVQKIAKYTIKAHTTGFTEAPRAWKFQGSVNNSDWIDLDTQSGFTSWSANELKSFTFINNNAYRYYRIYVTELNSYQVYMVEIQMMKII